MARRSFKGTSAPTTLSAGINASVTAVPLTDGSTYLDGSAGTFFVVLDKGLVGEEKILVTTRVGNSFTVVTRGQDGTTAVAHGSGASVNHCFTAVDADEANAHVNASAAVHGLTGTVVGTTDTQTLTGKTVNLASNTVTGTTALFNTALSDNDFATLAGAETLTNKTLTAPAIGGATAFTGTQAGAVLDAASTIGGVSGTTLAALTAAWTAYTPTWAATGSSLGNGVVTGAYRQTGKAVEIAIHFKPGSTTTFGTGAWTFTLPGGMTGVSTRSQTLRGEVFVGNVTGTNYFVAVGLIVASSSTIRVMSNSSTTKADLADVTATVPVAPYLPDNPFTVLNGTIEIA